ncbi:uncharacterized protein J8A68_005479 [[Candida] subhashii]|uniref:J domain-containing protein n=1 Tax=[Candida] subhashii TaxID=561895 RepID=A0A8J5Q2V9_9ASCO|nr:uncharacterized protein J8A68_005479 [[Candida] subhashii]KAG7660959.1 hypothetical protein J8A68_005479 [[Candida] subhashii]
MVKETYLYDLLGVEISSTTEEIARTYKRQALKCHPDKTNHDPELTEKFKELTRAYEILRDPKQRSVYDKYGEAGLDGVIEVASSSQAPSTQQRRGGGGGRPPFPNDIFSQVFNDINSMFSQHSMFNFPPPPPGGQQTFVRTSTTSFSGIPNLQQQQQQNMKKVVQPYGSPLDQEFVRGEDIHHTCDVNLGDFVYGKTIKLNLPKNVKCEVCQGYGGYNPKTCKQCEGSGKIITTFYNNFSQFQQTGSCQPCNGTGIFIDPNDRCPACAFTGYVHETKLIKVNVLPGCKNGDRIILQGEADEGKNIIPGDVVIHLRERSHPYLIRKYNDLYMDYEIDLKTALLGGQITIPNFLKQGQSLRIYINVHGNRSINNSNNPLIQEGEIVGTINSGEPKIVKGLGIPINEITKGGELIQNLEDVDGLRDVLFDLSRYNRGNLYINFHVRLPSISDFSEPDLLKLGEILHHNTTSNPNGQTSSSSSSSTPEAERRGTTLESHLSNIPMRQQSQQRGSSASPSKDYNMGNMDDDAYFDTSKNGKRRRY